MRTFLTAAFLCSFASSISAQTVSAPSSPVTGIPASTRPNDTPYTVTERKENSRTWQRTTYEQRRNGEWVPHIHRYEEVATGMHYRDANGDLVESKEEIVPSPTGGAQAIQGKHQVFFPYDIYTGVIETVTGSGEYLKSRPIGISFFDGTNSVLIAELTNSIGRIISPNQIIYANAFTDFPADLLVTYRMSGLECDLVFRSQIPAPEKFALSSSNTRLELLTEFFDTPAPQAVDATVDPASGLSDSMLTFGSMTMARGIAFQIGGQAQATGRSAPAIAVAKTWLPNLDGRTVLVEELRYKDIKPSLQTLPSLTTTATPLTSASAGSALHTVSTSRLLPPIRLAQASTNVVHVAKADPPGKPGVIWDYILVNTQTNMTFRSDTTYYVSNSVNLSGTTVIEGGTVIKYDTNYACAVNILGSVQCLTGPYHPAVLTSANDPTVGDTIGVSAPACAQPFNLHVKSHITSDLYVYVFSYDGGFHYIINNGGPIPSGGSQTFSFTAGYGQTLIFDSGDADDNEYDVEFTPTLQDGAVDVYPPNEAEYSESNESLCVPTSSSTALSLENGTSLHDLIIRYVGTGIQINGSSSVTNMQFVGCQQAAFYLSPLGSASLYAGNVLVSGSSNAFAGQSFNVRAEQLTCDNGYYVANADNGSASSITLTNCLITVPNWGNTTFHTNKVVKLSGSSVYLTAGAGSYYLGTNSAGLIGVTNITPALLAQLQQKTVYPPTVYSSSTIPTNVEFSAQVPRDTNGPVIGYHYSPLDYCFGGVTASSNLTFDAGTAVGWFETSVGNGYGIALSNDSTNVFNGTVTSPCVFARYNTVQEGGNGNWTAKGTLAGISTVGDSSYFAEIDAKFLHSYAFAADPNHFRDYYAQLNVHANDCEFYSGTITGYWLGMFTTNCLFDRLNVGTQQQSAGIYLRNCTMHGGGIFADHNWGVDWPVWIENCAFDGSPQLMDANTNMTYCNYNAFLNGAQRLIVQGSNDIVLTNTFTWQSGPLGNFYQSTNSLLINTGSVTADIIGLYHFTTQTNQTIEGDSQVDIGYHYLATDTNGFPLDSNGDGIPDYLEDPLGNGSPYDGTNWALAILTQPTNITAYSGTSPFFFVSAGGVPTLTYQWYSNSTAIAGATSSNLVFSNVQTNATGNYFVVVTNNFGSITSSVTLTVVASPPFITQEPSNVMVLVGSNATFNVTASGSLPLSYQWYSGTSARAGATTNSLTLTNVQLTDGGNYFVVVTNNYGAATSAVVNLVDYSNAVSFDTTNGQYYFIYKGSDETLSNWYVPVWPNPTNGWTNGTLNELACIVNGTNEFLPSNRGGLSLIANDSSNPANHPEIVPWDPLNTFTNLSNVVSGNSLQSTWQMNYASNTVTGSLTYSFAFQMTNRTLYIRVTNTSGVSGGLYLDRCETNNQIPPISPSVINVPYLTMFNVLDWNGVFASMYVDWENTSASTIYPLDGVYPTDSTSVYYAQQALYLPRTDGTRNNVNETIYLTVSPSLSDVLPTLQNPQSTYKNEAATNLVFDNGECSENPLIPFSIVTNQLLTLQNNGVTNLWVQLHTWQNLGYDNGYPDVLPAGSNWGGNAGLLIVSQIASNAGYRFALHENYVDFYTNATSDLNTNFHWNSNNCALVTNNNNSTRLSWLNTNAWNGSGLTSVQSYEMKPTQATNYAGHFSLLIHSNFNTTASFLDVHSSVNPSDEVDYDTNASGAGSFHEVLSQYRGLMGLLRTNHNGPVSGEGDNHMLYVGYIDDVEAQINSGSMIPMTTNTDPQQWSAVALQGQWMPLLVDFDLLKLHDKALVHGVGYLERFYAGTNNAATNYTTYLKNDVLEYMATELAYGHGGFIATPGRYNYFDGTNTYNTNAFVKVAQLEESYVLPVQRLYANATPVSILYHDPTNGDEVSASDYIRRYPTTFANQHSTNNYMSQVRVTYDNGIVVCANRNPNPQRQWVVHLGQSGGWFDYNAVMNNTNVQWAGYTNATSYTLPPNNGWVIYVPAPLLTSPR